MRLVLLNYHIFRELSRLHDMEPAGLSTVDALTDSAFDSYW